MTDRLEATPGALDAVSHRRPSGRSLALAAGAGLVAVVLAGIGLVGAGVLPGAGTAAVAAPHFVDETAAAGIDLTYDGEAPFSVGGGVAVLDCDGDGKPDLYIAGGGSARAVLYHDDSPVGGALRFTAIHDAATGLTDVTGAYPLDVDGDGQVDLAVLRAGGLTLLRGLGGCQFAPADDRWGLAAGSGLVTAFSATWEGEASLPTLAVGRYLRLDQTGAETTDCDTNSLLRPDSTGARYGPPVELSPGYCTLSMLFSDWDGSGRRDLRVTNDRNYYIDGSDQLWRVTPGEPPRLYTAADGWQPLRIWGMGIASYDVTGDGHPDVYLTSQGDNKLQTLAAGPSAPTFQDIALTRGVTAAQPFTGGDVLPSTAWHPEFQDVNNDGRIDLFVSKGNVRAQPDYAIKDPSDLLLGQPDGTFAEGAAAAGIVDFGKGRGAALADFNLDGLLDLVEVHLGDPVRLWRNVGAGDAAAPAPMGAWLAVRVGQPGPNVDAIGGWVEVRTGDLSTRRELTVGGGHLGGQLGWLHFGLGTAASAEVRVTWPDGEVGPWQRVAPDTFVDLTRGTAPRPWQPGG